MRSHDALASFIPSGDRVMPRTAALWALIVLKQRPLERSQNLIVASSPALMSTLLSAVTASARTQAVWPFNVREGLWGRCLTWYLGLPAASKHLNVRCEFVGIRIPLSADLKHSTPRGVLLCGCLAVELACEADHEVFRHAASAPALR